VHEFEYELGPHIPAEEWSQGVTLFLNPDARFPLGSDALPASSTFAVEGGNLSRHVEAFSPTPPLEGESEP
jgi:hypothetical protein